MTDTTGNRGDWQGVAASFRVLGDRLKGHAVDAGGAISSAHGESSGGAAEQVSAVFKAAVGKLDETVTDPDVAAATKDATARLLDAIKAELTGETGETPAPAAEPGPPKPIEG